MLNNESKLKNYYGNIYILKNLYTLVGIGCDIFERMYGQ